MGTMLGDFVQTFRPAAQMVTVSGMELALFAIPCHSISVLKIASEISASLSKATVAF